MRYTLEREAQVSEFEDKVVHINRCAKTVKGGRRMSFSALVVVGNKNGKVGVGLGKAKEVSEAIRKGTEAAQRNIVEVQLLDGTVLLPVQFSNSPVSATSSRRFTVPPTRALSSALAWKACFLRRTNRTAPSCVVLKPKE